MGMISQMEVVSDVWLWGLLARPSLMVRGLWLCSLVSVYVAWQPAFLCLSPHNGDYLQHSSVCVRCLRCSQALANPSTQPRGWYHVQLIRMDTFECFHWKPAIHRRYFLCKNVSSPLTGHYVIKRLVQKRFWNNSWHDDASSLTCFIIAFFFRVTVPSLHLFFKKCKHVYSKPFPPLFILLQLFCSLSCSDATAVQTPFPPADSVASLRRCGSGCWWRGGGGGGSARLPHQAHQPITCEGKELANRFYNGTLHTVTQNHKPLSSPTLLLYYAAVAYKSTCDVCKCANTQGCTKKSTVWRNAHASVYVM